MSWMLRGHGYEASKLMRGDGRKDWFRRYTEASVGPIVCKAPQCHLGRGFQKTLGPLDVVLSGEVRTGAEM